MPLQALNAFLNSAGASSITARASVAGQDALSWAHMPGKIRKSVRNLGDAYAGKLRVTSDAGGGVLIAAELMVSGRQVSFHSMLTFQPVSHFNVSQLNEALKERHRHCAVSN
jgi:hypothetical protein